MFSYFHSYKNHYKGQVFPLLIAMAAILSIAALISANLGKVSLDRVYTMNAADAGALAGISDFTCAYNKAWFYHIVMFNLYMGVQIWLALPQQSSACLSGYFACPACYFSRDSIAQICRDTNRYLYYAWRGIVRGYSESARKDAFYYALINAGIDDKFKWDPDEGAYRDKPHPTETWSHWQSLDSAFGKWLHDLPEKWWFRDISGNLIPGDTLDDINANRTSYLTYTWHDNSKSVTVAVTVPRADSSRTKWVLFGSYGLIIPPYVWLYWFPLPHGDMSDMGRVFVKLENPATRYCRVKVERRNLTPQIKDLGFWQTRQPAIIAAESEADMEGSVWSVQFIHGALRGNFDFKLRRLQ